MDTSKLEYHPLSEVIVEGTLRKTQSNHAHFARVLVAYMLCKIPSMLHVSVYAKHIGKVPINMYTISLAPSGFGKGHSNHILDEYVFDGFLKKFLNNVFPSCALQNIGKLANEFAAKNLSDADTEKEKLLTEYKKLGEYLPFFDSGTTPGLKQGRQKILMAGCGALNFEMDEIGTNFVHNGELRAPCYELYDSGKTKPKIIKSTPDTVRFGELLGETPTNMMLYGTQSKLFDGGKTEEEFISTLESGYARRCIYSYIKESVVLSELSAEQLYDKICDSIGDEEFNKINNRLAKLADIANVGKVVTVPKKVSLELIRYRENCKKRALSLSNYDTMLRSELAHRYFRVLKLAGAYAFVDRTLLMEHKHLAYAIKLVEKSGEHFKKMLARDRPYVRLAKYISYVRDPITLADLTQDLPFFTGAVQHKKELVNLAIAWGFSNNITITRFMREGVEFIQGEKMTQTNINKLVLSYSKRITEGYKNKYVKFSAIHKLCTTPDYHFINHFVLPKGVSSRSSDGTHESYNDKIGYRHTDSVLSGSNIVILDVDKGVSMDLVGTLLQGYLHFMYTTKRNTEESNRFRVILVLDHVVKLNEDAYCKFMKNIYKWLPFPVDTATGQRSRKWLTNGVDVTTRYGKGDTLNVFDFLPGVTLTERTKLNATISSMGRLERWFISNCIEGNRSNVLIRYAYTLIDHNIEELTEDSLKNKILAVNAKTSDPLTDEELSRTVIPSACNHLRSKQ